MLTGAVCRLGSVLHLDTSDLSSDPSGCNLTVIRRRDSVESGNYNLLQLMRNFLG
jgi:hypothetical protein